MLLEEDMEEEEDVGSLLAGTIEKGMRTVLQTVSRPSLDSRSASIGQHSGNLASIIYSNNFDFYLKNFFN